MKCDELKERWFEAYPVEGDQLIPVEVYSKKDADEAIKEMNDKLRHYPMFIAMLESDKLEIAKDKIKIRHQKYKRCLAIADSCQYKIKYWSMRYTTAAGYDRSYEKRKHKLLAKWRKRWLDIAEKFKEACR